MEDKKYTRYFWILLSVTTITRLWLAGTLGLGIDEAHYVQYALNPALSYYDHPPLVGYLIRFFMLLSGQHLLSVRMPAIISGIGTAMLLFMLGKKLYGPASGFWAAVFFNCIPLFSAVGGITVVPDTILCFLYLLAIYILWHTHETGNGRFWYAIGAVTGLAMLAKYTAAFLYPSIFMFTLFVPSMRKWFKKKHLYLAFVISVLLFLPVIIWNYENHWASFAFQFAHGLGEKAFFRPITFIRNFGAQAGVFSPLIFLFIIFTFFRALRSSLAKDVKTFLLFSFALPVILLFAYSSLANDVLPHWPAVGYLVLLPLAGKLSCELSSNPRNKGARVFIKSALVLGAALTIVMPAQAVFKIFPLPADIDVTNDLLGWEELAEYITTLKEQEKDSDFFVFTHTFYITGQLAFYLDSDVDIYCLSRRVDQYDFWQYPENLKKTLDGRNGIYFCDTGFKRFPGDMYHFDYISDKKTLPVMHRGTHAKNFYIYRCYGFNTEKTDRLYLQSLPFQPRKFRHKLQDWNEKGFFAINRLAGQNTHVDKIFISAGWLGSGYILIPLTGLAIWAKKRRCFRQYFIPFLLAMVIGGLAVYLLKEFFSMPRPPAYFPESTPFNLLGPPLQKGSFPSGHTQTVFTGVLFLSKILPKYLVLFWIAGIMTAISRCYTGVHFPADLIGGVAIALASFLLVQRMLPDVYCHRKTQAGQTERVAKSETGGECDA